MEREGEGRRVEGDRKEEGIEGRREVEGLSRYSITYLPVQKLQICMTVNCIVSAE